MCATRDFNAPEQERGSQSALLHPSQYFPRTAPCISATEGPIIFFICRNGSDVLADILRDSAALCPSSEPVPDVTPGFQQKSGDFLVHISQSAPVPLTFSHSDQDWVKAGYDSCSGKGCVYLQPHRHLQGWHRCRSEGLQAKDGQEGSGQ